MFFRRKTEFLVVPMYKDVIFFFFSKYLAVAVSAVTVQLQTQKSYRFRDLGLG